MRQETLRIAAEQQHGGNTRAVHAANIQYKAKLGEKCLQRRGRGLGKPELLGIFAGGHQREIEVEIGKRRGLNWKVVVIGLGLDGRCAEMALLAGERVIQIGEQLVETVDQAQAEIAAKPVLQFSDM